MFNSSWINSTFAVLVIAMTLSAPVTSAQNALLTALDSSLTEFPEDDLDTLLLFQLIDSLLLLEPKRASLFSLHLGYISEVSNAGRTLAVKQFGFNPGISYFHKSGVYGNVTGYWNSDLDTSYDLTVIALGYIGFLSPKLSYSISYDHSFFTDTEIDLDLPMWVINQLLPPILNNSVSGGVNLDFGPIETSIDYSWLFNDESAHRAQWRLTGDLKKYRWIGLDRVSLRPAFEVMFGSLEVISVSFSREAFIQHRFPYLINKKNKFGLMNYRLRLPLGLTKDSFQLIFEYNYNIPISLPGEDFDYPNSGFFSIDLYYNFAIGAKKGIFE